MAGPGLQPSLLVPLPVPTLLLPETLDRKGYWLVCAVDLPPGTGVEAARASSAVRQAREHFVRDMAKQGWTFTGTWAKELRGPEPTVAPRDLPTPPAPRSVGPGREHPRSDGMPHPNEFVDDTPALEACDSWLYKFAGLFHRPAIRFQVPIYDEGKR